ncbi:YmL10 [Sorochytrium milnesiophthora]
MLCVRTTVTGARSPLLAQQTRAFQSCQIPASKRKFPLAKRLMMEDYDRILPKSSIYLLQTSSLTATEWTQLRKELKKQSMAVKALHNGVFGVMSKRQPSSRQLAPLLQGQTAIVFPETADAVPASAGNVEPTAVSSILTAIRPQKKVSLLAAVIDNKFHAVTDVERYATSPSMAQLHSELVGVLSYPAQRLAGVLEQSQKALILNLEQRVKDMTPITTTSSAAADDNTPATA